MERSTNFRPRRGILALMLSTALTLTACGSSTDEPANTKANGDGRLTKVALGLATEEGAVYVQMKDDLVAKAKELGVEFRVFNNNGSAEGMLRAADEMVAYKPDVILEEAPVADAGDRVGQMFEDAGIPCIAVNVAVNKCHLFNFDQPYLSALVAKDLAGKMKARKWTAADTTVIIGQNSNYGDSVNVAVWSFYEAISSLLDGMTEMPASKIDNGTTTIVEGQGVQVDLKTTLDEGFDAMTRLLPTIPEDRHVLVYTLSDESAQGVIRALNNAGRADDAMVVGYGESDIAIKAIQAGDGPWTAEAAGFFTSWGQFLLAQAQAIVDGADIPELTAPPMVSITQENVNDYFDANGKVKQFPPLPKDSEYLAKTGVLQKFGNVQGVN
jgi:ribose transport system substrate-binding protein